MEGVLRREIVGFEDDDLLLGSTNNNSQKGVSVGVDEFSVDELFDFSNEDGLIEQEQSPQSPVSTLDDKKVLTNCEEDEEKGTQKDESFNFDDFGPIPVGDLSVPVEKEIFFVFFFPKCFSFLGFV